MHVKDLSFKVTVKENEYVTFKVMGVWRVRISVNLKEDKKKRQNLKSKMLEI